MIETILTFLLYTCLSMIGMFILGVVAFQIDEWREYHRVERKLMNDPECMNGRL